MTGTRFAEYSPQDKLRELADIAKRLTVQGKGIIAGDEKMFTCAKLLNEANLENTEDNKKRWIDLLMTTDKVAENISGVILLDQTVRRTDKNGVPVAEVFNKKGIIAGIKVDKGVVPLAGTLDECTTSGLDGLKERCDEYKRMGCHFAKWRCVFKITEYTPSYLAMIENANVLARFAAICQQSGLVPIVEPGIPADGTHDLQMSKRVTEEVLRFVFKALADHHVYLEGTLLRLNMVTAGLRFSGHKPTPEDAALATVKALSRTVPPEVAGVVFLSEANGEESSSVHLNAINKVPLRRPWPLTFAFGRAMMTSVMITWGGKDGNVKKAQETFKKIAQLHCQASQGQYKGGAAGVANERSIFLAGQTD